MADLTPMKKQYRQIKEENPDCLLFFRLGDFYEMFEDDAITASKALNLTLTTRDRNKPQDEQTPMCGVPYHAAQTYISKLMAQGYKIAICDQVEKPGRGKTLLRREVIRIISPGTVTDEGMLDAGSSNYICALYLDKDAGAAAFCDISTGEFCAAAFDSDCRCHMANELGRFLPREAVLSDGAAEDKELRLFMKHRLQCLCEARGERFEYDSCAKRVCAQFAVEDPKRLLGGSEAAVRACGALLGYVSEMQKCDISNIRSVDMFEGGKYMEMDFATRRNLELTRNLRTGEKRGSLLSVLDRTRTPMGGRLLRSWIERPLLSPVAIKRRLSAVSELREDGVLRAVLMHSLGNIADMQRLISRVVLGEAGPRDVSTLGVCCAQLPQLAKLLSGSRSALLRSVAEMDALEDVCWTIQWAIGDEPPIGAKDGGILREHYSEKVDRLREVRDNGAKLVSELEAREREKTGIKKLKVGYNKVFGYYIDIPNSARAGELPPEYIRKQTTTSGERYFTAELKDLETEISSAHEKLCELEYELFCELRDKVAAQVARIQDAADTVGSLDVLCSLAEVAVRNRYVCPEIDLSGAIEIKEGRHPVVEQVQSDSLFVPNDSLLNMGADRVAIITGPNMAGKSTFMRQTALITLMAQMGSHVPAKSATIGLVDRVFTRIGASDDLAGGQSTFMVEMTEVSDILKYATSRSLIILDEVGRGTSTYDGMAIARAVLEYCADPKCLGAKTMFATHYHELTALEGGIPGVRNYHITARKQGDSLTFLRKIVRGAADESYGIEVAQLAGVPARVVRRARACLKELNDSGAPAPARPVQSVDEDAQLSFGDAAEDEVIEKLRLAPLDTLSPIEAMNLLYELKRKLEG